MRELELHSVLAALQRHIGSANGVTAEQLVAEVTGSPVKDAAAERQLREIIVQLRLRGWHLCGHPAEGYYIAANAEELEDTCRFLCERALKSLVQVQAMKNIALPDLLGQLRINT